MPKPNYSYINQLSNGDKAFEAKLLGVLAKELPLEIQEFESNIALGNLAEAANNVHKIKHKISLLGMQESYLIAQDFEENLKNNRLDLYKVFVQILKKMTTFLNQL
ncbi:Hpt domain-containing protein [uncultured Roseivirga sp.]|uniref:Hpt domain-containing protein n=1 Tax=uncultured Roseivirga sp. TaxID=543088 RepID=UPI0030D8DC4F|tara:strand:+ start:20545 stop:20862 length:318 start_codon:yes stop_codon:yes gene_type:complete